MIRHDYTVQEVRAIHDLPLPRLMLRCGTEDHLLAQNRRFVQACARADLELDAGFGPGGHTWEYWDQQLPGVLDWMIKR